jgi:hypothetical protein
MMKKRGIFPFVIEKKRQFITGLNPADMNGYDGKSFTRKRSLTFGRMLLMLLRISAYGLQIRLDNFFEEIGHKDETVSKQAFSKARGNIDPGIIKESFSLTTRTILECDDLEYFKDIFRLCAFDGSELALDNAAALKNHFGTSGSKNATTALASVAYDPLNNIILAGELSPCQTDERDTLREQLKIVEALPRPDEIKNLYLADRGLPSKELFAEFLDNNLYFLIRVRKKFNISFDLVEKDEWISFVSNEKEYRIRVLAITLDSEEKEILATNLEDKYLKWEEAGELYFKRWAIEGKFNSLKNKLELENISGRRQITVEQDFWAKLDIANTMAALKFTTNEEIEEKTAERENKYEQTTNENRLINKFSKRYIDLLCNPSKDAREILFNELIADITRYPVEKKPDRKTPRKTPRKMKFPDRNKRCLQ